MRKNNRFEQIDRAALNNALLALKTCPHCRNNLRPVAFCLNVWGCANCKETWNDDAGEYLYEQRTMGL